MTNRLYVPEALESGCSVILSKEQCHHLLNVLRLAVGDEIQCFDGSGSQFTAKIVGADRKKCKLSISTETTMDTPIPKALHLGISWLKGSSMDLVVQKTTELGVTDLWPIQAERSNVKMNAARIESRLKHWHKIAIHATEQSERLFIPKIHEPVTTQQFLKKNQGVNTIILHPNSPALNGQMKHQELALMIGPEGGWTKEELVLAEDCGAKIRGLGSKILRAETAPLAAIASVNQIWGWP